MATAEKQFPVDFDIVLTLTKKEADVLWFIMRSISGDPLLSPRALTDKIGWALSDVLQDEVKFKVRDGSSTIYLMSTTAEK